MIRKSYHWKRDCGWDTVYRGITPHRRGPYHIQEHFTFYDNGYLRCKCGAHVRMDSGEKMFKQRSADFRRWHDDP